MKAGGSDGGAQQTLFPPPPPATPLPPTFGRRSPPHFDGATYEAGLDGKRLTGQVKRLLNLMADRRWRTLPEISPAIGASETSASARLRDLRKARYGWHRVDRRRRGGPTTGTWEYRVLLRASEAAP